MTINDAGAIDGQQDEPVVGAPVGGTMPSVAAACIARRQMIKSALAAVPVVLTITAGTAKAQGGASVMGSPVSDSEQADSEALTDEDSSKAGTSSPYSTNRNSTAD